MGWYLDTTVDWTTFESIFLDAGAEAVYWFEWTFDDRHWQRMSLTPDIPGEVEIVREWTTREQSQDRRGTRTRTRLWVHMRNGGAEPVALVPSALVTPSQYPR